MIPNATSMARLLPPHFALGLGIGIVDAALVPLLATFMDANSLDAENDELFGSTGSHYGLVYAIQQTAVSLAYSLAPIIGGELAQNIGFSWLMVVIGGANLIYSGYLILTMKSLQVSGCETRRQRLKGNQFFFHFSFSILFLPSRESSSKAKIW
jgi:MFS family permease